MPLIHRVGRGVGAVIRLVSMENPRFLSLEDVAEELNVNMPLARALVTRGELRGIKVGARGIWRVERAELEAYIQRMYTATAESLGAEADASVEA